MAWCPKCKSEYVEGMTRCADCNCELVDSLQEQQKMTAWEEEVTLRAIQLKQKEVQAKVDEEVLVNALEEMATSGEFEFEEPVEKPKHVMPYMNNEEQAMEHKASAHSLLVIGLIGLIFIILLFFDVLPIRMATVNKYIVSGVMGALFTLFLVMGVISLKKSKVLVKKAKKENDLTKEIKKWCRDYMIAQEIDAQLPIEEETEEVKYFQRFDKMKEMIQNQFMYLDDGYLDRLIDEIYPEIFEAE